jgi:hypothetical protein
VEEGLQELLQFGHYPDSHLQEAQELALLQPSDSDFLRSGSSHSDLLLLSRSDLLQLGLDRSDRENGGYSDHYLGLGLGLASLEFGYLDCLRLLSFLSMTC